MSKTKGFLLAVAVAAMAFTFSCSSDDGDGGGNPPGDGGSVSHGGQSYKTVKIGDQTWMAENLNYNPGTGNSVCYDNSPANCTKYGRLYDWETAKTVCPAGWHLPSDAEWTALINHVGGESTAGTKLKAKSGWDTDGYIAGTDNYGFSALPGGRSYSDGSFDDLDEYVSWWSSTDYDSDRAYFRRIDYNRENVTRNYRAKEYMFSVRCVQGSSGDGGGGDGSSSSIASGGSSPSGSGSVSHGGQSYKTVKIGNQTWMAENLNYNPGTGNSVCYDNSPANCTKYGRLYDWETAKTVCPDDWHLPSDEEWSTLSIYAGNTRGTKLKSTTGWNTCGSCITGTDNYGFSALPGGYGNPDGSFNYVGDVGYWWSSSEFDSDNAHHMDIFKTSEASSFGGDGKDFLRSVRCVKDEGGSP